MSYKVTIIDNETNEVILDTENAAAIIGVVAGEEGVHCLGQTNCDGVQLLSTLHGVDAAKDALLKDNPEIRAIYICWKS